jgi:hypothetical protein
MFLKTMNQIGDSFWYLQQNFPWISDEKIKERIFISPHLRELRDERILMKSWKELSWYSD